MCKKKIIAKMAPTTEATPQDSIQQIERINLEEKLITSVTDNLISILEELIDNNRKHQLQGKEQEEEDGVDQYIRNFMGGQIGARIPQFPTSSISI